MKKEILFSTFVLCSTLLNAQTYVPFPDSNAYWNEVELYQGQCEPPEFCKRTYFLMGDTIIDAFSYKKIYADDGSSISYVGGLREENKKVYLFYKSCDQSIILFDFNVNVGDTVAKSCLVIGCLPFENTYMTVVSRDSILLEDGSYRNRINFDDGPQASWIEGIGSVSGLLYPYYSCALCICFLELVCFEQNDVTLYQNEEHVECFNYTVSVDETDSNPPVIKVYPNPVKKISVLNIEAYSESVTSIEMFDIFGRRTVNLQCGNTKKYQLPLETFRKGIYFLRVSLSNDSKYYTKLIIE